MECVASISRVEGSQSSYFYLEDGNTTYLQNISNDLLVYVVTFQKTVIFTQSLQCETKISHYFTRCFTQVWKLGSHPVRRIEDGWKQTAEENIWTWKSGQNVVCEGLDRIHWGQGQIAGYCKNGDQFYSSIKAENFLIVRITINFLRYTLHQKIATRFLQHYNLLNIQLNAVRSLQCIT
jgi:hypothetical protein